jgi:hypothetical protein
VLQRHREERDRSARAAVPELPQPILRLFEQLWAEAWRQADAIADVERQTHAKEKTASENARGEMQAEIRLEAKAEMLQSAELQGAPVAGRVGGGAERSATGATACSKFRSSSLRGWSGLPVPKLSSKGQLRKKANQGSKTPSNREGHPVRARVR